MAELVKVAGVQSHVVMGQPKANLGRIVDALHETARNGAFLTVFPECAVTGYCFDSLDEAMPLAEPIPGNSTQQVGDVCRRLGVYAVFGMLERDSDRLFNACVLVGPSGVVGSYRKIHLPFLGIDRFATPGDRPFGVHAAGPINVGMNICYDGAFPESARVMALAGADLIVLPTNWPPSAECFADYVINARAMENCLYYLAVNRVGTEREFRFIGKSKICDTDGMTMTSASAEDETLLYAEIDVRRARNKHLVRVPNKHEIDRFADRRPEMYQLLTAPLRRKP